MRVRKVDATGDILFGHGGADYWINSPDAVAQAIKTRLLLFTGEWFIDLSEGTPWATRVLGKGRAGYDAVIKSRILGTEGVKGIVAGSYQSSISARRALSVSCIVNTIYGQVQISVSLAPMSVASASVAASPAPAIIDWRNLDFTDPNNSGHIATLGL